MRGMVAFVPTSRNDMGLYENLQPLGGGKVYHTATAVASDRKLTRSLIVYHNSIVSKNIFTKK